MIMKHYFQKYYKYLLAAYFCLCAIAAWYWTVKEMAKKELISYLWGRYSFADFIQVKRGPYSGCYGQIWASKNLEYIVHFSECNGKQRFHALVHADEFDDKALNFMEKF